MSTSFLTGRIAACHDRVSLFLDEMNYRFPRSRILFYPTKYKEKQEIHISREYDRKRILSKILLLNSLSFIFY